MDENLPVKTDENFFAEGEKMSLETIKKLLFLVAVSTGDRNKSKFLPSTVRGPFEFAEMVQEVGSMWVEEQHHAKVVILSKDRKEAIKTLDQNTTDYIECHYTDIITDAFLEGCLDNKEYTCKAGLISNFESEVKTDQIENATTK